VRFGIMIVGNAMTGKSTLLNTLKQAHIMLFEKGECKANEYNKIECSTFNPKAISIEELYGNFDKHT
jgi:dynein heavy chain